MIRSKYGNRKTEVEGLVFDSRAEARRFQELRLLESAGAITHLEVQPRFPLVVNGQKVGVYFADFRYRDVAAEAMIVEDVKGVRTPIYKLKKKLVLALHGVEITEVGA